MHIGSSIGRYKIVAKLGEGGMGVVYKAEDTKLERTVALKFLAQHLLGDDEAKERFLREAKAAAALDHPNICTVYEIADVDGKTFISMAFLKGELRDSKKYRDILAHGVWGIDPDSGDHAIQYTGGNWKPDARGPKISRRITPEGMIADVPTLEKIGELLAKTIDLTVECVNELIPEDEPAPDET